MALSIGKSATSRYGFLNLAQGVFPHERMKEVLTILQNSMTIRTMSLAEHPLDRSDQSLSVTTGESRPDLPDDPEIRAASRDAARLVTRQMPEATVMQRVAAVAAILMALFHRKE